MKSTHHAPLFTELIFNYGDKFCVSGQNVENTNNRGDHHIISGLKTTPFSCEVIGEYKSIGFILKPFCYGLIVNKFGTKDMDLISELLYNYYFISNNSNFEKIENELLKLFNYKDLDTDILKFEDFTTKNILRKGSIKNFTSLIDITQKSFINKFKKLYLITPNEYHKLKRVNIAINMLTSNQSEKLNNTGLDAGFYDQSHFIRSFKQYCGFTPKEFKNYQKVNFIQF